MKIRIDQKSSTPIFRQIVDAIARDISNGVMQPGEKLPTVRELSIDSGISRGTVKHAYDVLEQRGIIEKTQGRGTFVCFIENGQSRKEQAMIAIDKLLDELQSLSFSNKEMRIYIDLKLREREKTSRPVRVCAVDCSIEALSVIAAQIAALANVDVYEYLLHNITDNTKNAGFDIWVTTPNHFEEVSEKCGAQPMRIVLTISSSTALELSRIPADANVGLMCVSERFSEIMQNTLKKYGGCSEVSEIAYFHDYEQSFFENKDVILLPPEYEKYIDELAREALRDKSTVVYQYQIDKGSIMYLEEAINLHYREINA